MRDLHRSVECFIAKQRSLRRALGVRVFTVGDKRHRFWVRLYKYYVSVEPKLFCALSFVLDVILDAHACVPAIGLLITAKTRWRAI